MSLVVRKLALGYPVQHALTVTRMLFSTERPTPRGPPRRGGGSGGDSGPKVDKSNALDPTFVVSSANAYIEGLKVASKPTPPPGGSSSGSSTSGSGSSTSAPSPGARPDVPRPMSRMSPYALKNLSMHEESKSPGSFPPPRSALDANPYGWREEARSARTAPLWMLYEEEREGVVSSAGGRKQWGRAQRFSPLIHAPVRDAAGRAGALGARKTSSARVWVKEGDGRFSVNSIPLHKYFPRHIHRTLAMEPLTATQAVGAFDVDVSVRGGGLSGQAGAVRHGLAKAMVNWDPNLSPLLKATGMLVRDPRMKERKKPGQKGARAKFQWVRR